jgi:hypothetical protein
LIVVAMPLAGEAVAWCSGVFDLLSTTFVLTSVLLARRYARPRLDPWLRGAFVVAAVAALGCKETGAIACAIVALDAWALRYLNRRLARDLAILFAAALAVAFWRLSTPGAPHLQLSRYALQRLLFNAFGSLAVPWRPNMAHGWLAAVQPVVVLVLSVTLVSNRSARHGTLRLLAATAAWIVVPLIPVAALFFVGAWLEGSRYLYLSTVGWALFVAVLASSNRPDAAPLRSWRQAAGSGVARWRGGQPGALASSIDAARRCGSGLHGRSTSQGNDAALRVRASRFRCRCLPVPKRPRRGVRQRPEDGGPRGVVGGRL